MVESWWLVAGRQCAPARLLALFRHRRWSFIGAAGVVAVIPFVNHVFWFNQGIWLIPALVLLPFVRAEPCPGTHFTRALIVSALLAGVAWEAFNYPARTHWEYLILAGVPHLFYMPLAGYLGFIPFALSMMAVHQWTRAMRASVWLGALLYVTAIAGLYWLTVLYIDQGIWISE